MHWGIMRDWIHLIASASYPFPAVMKALAEPMCVFPVEGLPNERYLPGTSVMDAVENRAEELLRTMFAGEYDYRATIQPHSGTQANQVVFNAVLGRDDVVLSLKPAEGGHISHKVLIGRQNRVVFYPLDDTGTIDAAALEELARRERPKLIIAGGSAYPREIDFARIGEIAHASGALLHADISHTATFIAAGIHRPVIPHADFVSFNTVKNMRGPNGGILLYRANHHERVAQGLFPATQGGANENMMFAKLVALEELAAIDLGAYARRLVAVARLIAKTLQERGVRVVTGGTDSHLVLLDLRNRGMTGAEGERRCERHRVLVNRNLIPNDRENPMVTSGIRIGSACITILGYSDDDVLRLSHWLANRFTHEEADDASTLIGELTARYNHALLPL
jgi:glycine hydroxymethyltransferase